MIVFEINVERAALFKAEGDAPVLAHGHGPSAFAVPLEFMEAVGRDVHALHVGRDRKRGQDVVYPLTIYRD
jgi:hypothetical protein